MGPVVVRSDKTARTIVKVEDHNELLFIKAPKNKSDRFDKRKKIAEAVEVGLGVGASVAQVAEMTAEDDGLRRRWSETVAGDGGRRRRQETVPTMVAGDGDQRRCRGGCRRRQWPETVAGDGGRRWWTAGKGQLGTSGNGQCKTGIRDCPLKYKGIATCGNGDKVKKDQKICSDTMKEFMMEMKTNLSISKDILRDTKEIKDLLQEIKKGKRDVKTGFDSRKDILQDIKELCYRNFWALYEWSLDNEPDVSSSNLGGTYSYHWGSPEFSKPPGAGFLRRDLKKSKKFSKCGENSGNLEEKKEERLQDLKKSKKLSKGGRVLTDGYQERRRIKVQNITSREKLGLASISMEENAMINYEGNDKVDKNKEPEAEDESHELSTKKKFRLNLKSYLYKKLIANILPSEIYEDALVGVTYKHTATLTHVEAGECVAALIPTSIPMKDETEPLNLASGSITDEDYQHLLTVDETNAKESDLIIGFEGILEIEPNSMSIAELQDEELKAAKPEQIEVGKTFVEAMKQDLMERDEALQQLKFPEYNLEDKVIPAKESIVRACK
ncbi:hypothetical protein V8G54_021945 [Vigna mungo]|uniref:Uncharacterized protein n=1 Tax=Vigna mungo TaxID=3915 RepID=A0AAQ3RXU6_VIGMU